MVCSELPNNPGRLVTSKVEVVATRVIQANKLPTPPMWMEHRPKEGTRGGPEAFELVAFCSSYEVEERAPYPGETKATIGAATWTRLDRATVEALIGQKV